MNLRFVRFLHCGTLLLAAGIFATEARASILEILPTTTPRWAGTDPKNPKADDIETITGFAGELEEFYKADVKKDEGNPAIESGIFAGSYSTLFSNPADDPADALIEWTGGSFIGVPEFLLVKGGAAHTPVWYIFDLGTLGWDGQMDIELTGFWPRQGAISHIGIYGTEAEEAPLVTPEPAALAIWSALAALGLAYFRKARPSRAEVTS